MPGNALTSSTIFQPRHITFVRYPCLALLKDHGVVRESLAMVPAFAEEVRYEPRPLIDDDAVAAHSFRDGPDDTQIYSVTSAPIETKDIRSNLSDIAFDNQRLVSDMGFIESCNGCTFLNAVTYVTDQGSPAEEPTIMFRVFLKTSFFFAGASRRQYTSTYEFSIKDFDAIEAGNKLWFANLVSLIDRRTDAAFLHVQAQLSMQHSRIEQANWRSPRQPDYEKVLTDMTVMPKLSSDGEEDDCPICRESLFTAEEVVQVPCEGKHEYHLKCLVEVCKAAGPEKSRCPLCRQDVIKNAEDVELLKYATVGKTYITDQRYSRFENFERSCADLDKTLAENSGARIGVSKVLLRAVLEMLTEAAKTELEAQTPHHLQPVRCAEFRLLELAVESAANSMNGMRINESLLYRAIRTEMLKNFGNEFKAGGMMSYLIGVELQNWWDDAVLAAKNYAMRPGFLSFAERMVSRMLRFVQLRACDCTPDKTFHWHGGRAYYNAKADELGLPQ